MDRILCVEDEVDFREDIAEFLRMNNYEVDEVGTGLEALEALESEQRYSLILCDVCMPRMNGHELLREIRFRHPEYLDTPFIFLTALSQKEDIIKGHAYGCDEYVTKPVDLDVLLAMVISRIERSKTLQILLSSHTETQHPQMVGMVSRELLGPLNDLIGLTSYLKGLEPDKRDYQMDKYIDKLNHLACTQLSLLRAGLHSLTTPANPMKIVLQPDTVGGLVERALEASFGKEHQSCHMALSPNIAREELQCDGFMLRRGLEHWMLANARHKGIQPSIYVDASMNKDKLSLMFADLPAENQLPDIEAKDGWVPETEMMRYGEYFRGRVIAFSYLSRLMHAHNGKACFAPLGQGKLALQLRFPSELCGISTVNQMAS